MASVATVANTMATTASQNISQQAQSNPNYLAGGGGPILGAVFPISNLTGSSAPTFSVSSAQSAIGILGIPNGGGVGDSIGPTIESVKFWGAMPASNAAGAMYLNIYQMNTTTGVLTRVYQSLELVFNAIVDTATTVAYNYVNLAPSDYIVTAQGNVYAAELVVLGAGTYNLVGIASHWLTPDTTFPLSMGAERAGSVPALDSVGTAQSAGGTTTVTVNIPITLVGPNLVVAACNYYWTNTDTATVTATMGGASGYSPGVNNYYAGAGANPAQAQTIFIWEGPPGFSTPFTPLPTGPQTVTVTLTISGGGTGGIVADATAFSGVTFWSATHLSTGTGTSLSNSIAMDSYTTAFNSFGAGGAQSITTTTGTEAWNGNSLGGIPTEGAYAQVTSPATASFQATLATTSPWGGYGLLMYGSGAPATYATSAGNASSNVPWFGFYGNAAASQYAPIWWQYGDPLPFGNPVTYNIPCAANGGPMQPGDLLDIVLIGGAGSGQTLTPDPPQLIYNPDGSVSGEYDWGGGPGAWGAVTLQWGGTAGAFPVIPTSTTTISVSIGAGGIITQYNDTGTQQGWFGVSGAVTTATVTGYGVVTAAAGAGADNLQSGFAGVGAGNFTYNGSTYYGGADQWSRGTRGNSPGGGGCAGNFGNSIAPGAGADGWASIVAYQPS
jgi:hypothetical protein